MQQLQDIYANYILITDTDNLVHKLCHYSAVTDLVKDLFYNNFPLILLVGSTIQEG